MKYWIWQVFSTVNAGCSKVQLNFEHWVFHVMESWNQPGWKGLSRSSDPTVP